MSAWSSACRYIRDFPQAMLDREINASFSETSTVTYFIISIRTVSSITEKKIAEIYGYVFGKWNKFYWGGMTGRKAHVKIRSDKGLALKTWAFESFYGSQFTLLTQLIKPNYPVILLPTQHHSFFRNLPPKIMFPLKDKKIAGYFKTFFPGRRWINNPRKSNSVSYNVLHWK